MAAAASEYLSEYEAERLVAELVRLDVKDLGGPRWERQHEIWERLNIQAHYNIKTGHDEFVTQALLVSVIVHNLLVTDIWKTSVFPHVAAHVAAQSSLKAYFMLFSEATLINLLEVVLFDKQACGQVGDILVNLVDYLVRKAVYLCTCDPQELSQTIKDANEYLSATESDWLKRNTAELDFSIAINSLVSLRYVTDSVDTLDMSVLSRMLRSQDKLARAF
ncbi:hypothetical protein HK105_209325 [Polyrhizophydium stewartii]|uniref:Uncharacterized protein n=1 Tax=Polyrhizophydium stewartii TaxID=2732419 RepID=A0ABR4MVC9_9FUNG